MTIQRLQRIQEQLNEQFFDREVEIEALLTALLSKQHILFIGPAGTGKSALSSALGKIIDHSIYFQHLLTPFSTPEELFGALSLKDLENGIYKRNIEHMLPTAHFAFIDEIFKANSAILNSLLTLINERIFYNNGKAIDSPLLTLVGSSNEYIEEDEGLEALFDRFLLRYEIKYIRDEQQFISMLKSNQSMTFDKLTYEELVELHQEVQTVTIPDSIYEALAKIRQQLSDEGIHPSDRRFKQSLNVLKARAVLKGRTTVTKGDLDILKHVLWETPEDQQQAQAIIQKVAHDSLEIFLNRVIPEFDQVIKQAEQIVHAKTPGQRGTLSELLMKGKSLFMEVQTMCKEMPNRNELYTLKNDMHKRLLQMTSDVIGF